MRVNGFVVHGAVTVAVFASGVGAAVSGATGSGITLAGPQVLRLIQNAPAALSSYPSVDMAMKLTFHINGRTASVDETGLTSHDGKTAQFEVKLPNGAGTLSAIAADSTLYIKASPTAAATLGKPWLGLSITTGARAPSAQTPTSSDALSYLQLMPGATGEVKVLGHQTISHVRTTHYRVTIDLLKAEQSMPPQLQHASAGQLQELGISTLPVDVWLDAQNVLRQEKLSVAVQGMRFDLQLNLSGSSTPLNVTAPPASQVHFVTTAAELFQLATQG